MVQKKYKEISKKKVDEHGIEYVSDDEQKELEEIFGDSLYEDDYDPSNCVRL